MGTVDLAKTSTPHLVEWWLLRLALYATAGLVAGPATIGAALVWQNLPLPLYWRRILYAAATTWLLVAVAAFEQGLITSLWSWWVVAFPLFPLCYLLLKGIDVFSHFTRPRALSDQLKELVEAEQRQDQTLAHRADRRAEPPTTPGWLRLGVFLKGDRFPLLTHIEKRDGWLWLSERCLDEHIFVLGTTGAGKSETIKRLLLEIFATTNRDVFFVDGKGDEGLAQDVRSLATHFGRGLAPVFRLGHQTHGAIYDGFRGQGSDVYNRLCALIGVEEAEGNAQYYADINRDLLQLVCYAPGGAPRNFEQVRERLSRPWLLRAYQHDRAEIEEIKTIEEKDIEGLKRRIRPLAREFGVVIGEEGFALEESHCAIFSLRTQSVGDSARRLIHFLVEDIKDFVGKRQRRPAVLVIDEFGQFKNDNILALLSMARSSNLGVILATQDVASLKDEPTKRLVLANTRTKLLMATDYPEDVGTLAGTILQLESSVQHKEGDPTGMGSARVQHSFKVDMNEVARLQPGEAFLIRQRHAAKLKVRAIGTLPPRCAAGAGAAPQAPYHRRRR